MGASCTFFNLRKRGGGVQKYLTYLPYLRVIGLVRDTKNVTGSNLFLYL